MKVFKGDGLFSKVRCSRSICDKFFLAPPLLGAACRGELLSWEERRTNRLCGSASDSELDGELMYRAAATRRETEGEEGREEDI